MTVFTSCDTLISEDSYTTSPDSSLSAGGLRPVQPPRLLHAYRVRQPSFRTMNRDEMPRSGHPQGVPLRDTASPSPCETPRHRRTSGARLVLDISARRSRLLGLDSNEQADGGCFWRRQPLLTWQLPPY